MKSKIIEQKLEFHEIACSHYIQGNDLCDDCQRNLGFNNKDHKLYDNFREFFKDDECLYFKNKYIKQID